MSQLAYGDFETSQHEVLECETFAKNMHGINQDGVCCVTINKHENVMHPQTPRKTRMQVQRWKHWKKKEWGYTP